MQKIKITLPDKTEIICSYSYKRVPLDETDITVFIKAWPDRYDNTVLVKETHRWSISLGENSFNKFKELFNAKGIEFIPVLLKEGHINFGNVYAIVDTVNDFKLAQILLGIAIFTICTHLFSTNEHQMQLFLSSVERRIISCITKDGYWDTEQLTDIWTILHTYFTLLQCRFEEIDK